ncbi:MAG: ParB/RepB/Spo0J family partition protein [Propylenella sp.]
MAISASNAKLQQIPVDGIDRNPDNPRIVFRSSDLDELQESIRRHGIQVPISVYREAGRYVLIDGERRWRCALKLNLKEVPALVQAKPGPLENLLLMFNIHALREQWDLLTIAMKLDDIIALMKNELGKTPTEAEISNQTGLNRAIIRRSKLLMALPQKYKDQILAELRKPKSQQKYTEDLFIEMERALTTVHRTVPEVIPDRETVRRVLLKKFSKGIINNRVLFRQVGKIARAEKVGVDRGLAIQELKKLFTDNSYKIEQAYSNSVGEAYVERDLGARIEGLLSLLDEVDAEELEGEVVQKLNALTDRISRLLREES